MLVIELLGHYGEPAERFPKPEWCMGVAIREIPEDEIDLRVSISCELDTGKESLGVLPLS